MMEVFVAIRAGFYMISALLPAMLADAFSRTYNTENAYSAFLNGVFSLSGMSAECRPRPYAVPIHIETENPTARTWTGLAWQMAGVSSFERTHANNISQSSTWIFLTIHDRVRKRKKTKTVQIAKVAIATARVAGALVSVMLEG